MKGLIFTYLLTYGGAVVALFNPFYGLLIYCFFSICSPRAMWFWAVPSGNYSRVVAIAMLVGWAWREGLGNWQLGRAKTPTMLLLCYLGWMTLSASQAIDSASAWLSVERLFKIVLPFLVGITIIDSVKKIRQLAWSLSLAGGYVAYEMNLKYWDGLAHGRGNVLLQEKFNGLDNNGIALLLVATAGVAFFLGVSEEIKWRRWLCFALAAFSAHGPMIADSRGGMLALAITGVVSFFLVAAHPRFYLFFAMAAVVGSILAGPPVVQRFATVFASEGKRDASAQSRLDIWADVWDLAQDNPFIGVGPQNWPRYSATVYGWRGEKQGHNTWLQACAEVGLPGALFFIGFYVSTVWLLWRHARPREDLEQWYGHSARMVIAGLAGFGVAALFITAEAVEIGYYIALIGVATLKVMPTHVGGGASPQTTRQVALQPAYQGQRPTG